MNALLRHAGWTVFIAVIFLASNACAISPVQLRCESLDHPLGVDVAGPRLSWILQSDKRGDRQTAYQIVAATSEDALKKGDSDLWDSGKVMSEETIQIAYAGKPLKSSQPVFWKVRAWDADGNVSAWSNPATWTMGILAPSAWKAKWISAAGAEKYGRSYPGFERSDFTRRQEFAGKYPYADKPGGPNFSSMLARRAFTVKPGLKRAVIHISGVGQYELSANGEKVGDDILSPGWTDYRKTVLYDTFDITHQLKPGDNAVGLILGNGMYNLQPDYQRYVKFLNSFGQLKAIAQLLLEYADGSVETIVTDKSWQVAPGPITFDNIFGGEDFDARLVQTGWDKSEFKPDSKWTAALETTGPGGALKGLSCAAPPMRAIETLQPVASKVIRTNVTVFDFGQNCSMMPRLSVSGARGSFVRIIPSELLKPDGTVDRNSCTQDGVRPAWWQYTLAGDGMENYFPKFFYQGCRYFQVELFPANGGGALPKIGKLEGVVVHSSAEPIGQFETSNPLFNRIYKLVRWAQRSNMASVMTDCPHREKLGWLEQTHLNGPSLRYNFDMAAFFQKTMNDMADAQLENGFVPNIAPEYFIAGPHDTGNAMRNSPEWGGAFIMVAWQQYQFNGDVALLRRYYDDMKRYVAFLGSTAKDHIVTTGLGDWYDIGPNPPWGSQLTPPALTATAFYQHFNWILARTAALLGKPEEEKDFDELANQIRTAFNKTFYHPETHQYATGSQCANSLGVVMDLVDEKDRAAVVDNIVADVRAKGLTTGDVGYRYLLRALADNGHSDVIYEMNNQSDKPGYGYQLKMGATSLTEKWDAGVGSFGSQNHFMLGQINEWFFHDLAGIQSDPGGPGFKKIIIKPAIVGDLTWVKSTYDSSHGPITTEWRRNAKMFTLNLEIPPGTMATVYVPAQAPDDVFENGGAVTKSRGVKFLRSENGRAVFEIVAGKYQFSVSPQRP
ncbi:MAG TPA: family 78 glycoside hydrolase catalytic domain [bacterium]|nr:family 78 glycoside hydrolase catalytic domain [bacterium]